MAAGRPRKPDSIKKANKSYRPSRARKEVPEFSSVVSAEPPAILSDPAKHEWFWMVKELNKYNLLQATDLTMLAIYCQSIARYWECVEIADREGIVVEGKDSNVISPYVRLGQLAYKRAMDIAKQFGFSPVSRQSLKIPNKAIEQDEYADILDPVE